MKTEYKIFQTKDEKMHCQQTGTTRFAKDNSSGRRIKSEGNTNLPKRNEEHQNDESVNNYNVYFV